MTAPPPDRPSSVNESLTPKRRTRVVENDEYAAFVRRVIRAYSRRVAAGDIDALADMAALADDLDHRHRATPSPGCAPGTATAGPTSACGSASPGRPPSSAGAVTPMTTTPNAPKTIVQVLILLAIGGMAGAASFTHVHDWTMHNAPPGTGGWFGWANAVISELTPTAAGLEIRRRKRHHRPITYPMAVLIAAAALSLTAQVAEATAQLHRLAPGRRPRPGLPGPVQTRPLPHPRAPVRRNPPRPAEHPGCTCLRATAPTRPLRRRSITAARTLLTSAQMAAFAHHQATGQPITAGDLAIHLAIPRALAGTFLHALDGTGTPNGHLARCHGRQRHPDHGEPPVTRPARCWLRRTPHGSGPGGEHRRWIAQSSLLTAATAFARAGHAYFTWLDHIWPAAHAQSLRLGGDLRVVDPRHRGAVSSGPAPPSALPDGSIYKAVREPPISACPSLRRDLSPRRLPAHPRRADRRQGRPPNRLRASGGVRYLHRSFLRPGPLPACPAPHLYR